MDPWVTVKDTGLHKYQVTRRGRRRIIPVDELLQPVDIKWLKMGEWSKVPALPRNSVSVVRMPQP